MAIKTTLCSLLCPSAALRGSEARCQSDLLNRSPVMVAQVETSFEEEVGGVDLF